MSKKALVCDTSLLLYLGRLNQIDLLPVLFEPIYVPEEVILELDVGRLVRADTIDPRKLNWVTQVTVSRDEIDSLPFHRLGRGEQAVIAYGYAHSSCLVGLDDRQARLFAEKLKLNVVGTVGVILKAKRVGIIPIVRPLLDELPRQGFRFSRDLYVEILRLANEEKG